MLKINRILFVSKITKLEILQDKFQCSLENLISKYRYHRIYRSIIDEYFGHFKTLDRLKQFFPDSLFININNLNKKLTQSFDLIISIGGDETFKYVLHHSDIKKIFLSIRSFRESEGQLSSYDYNQIEKVVFDLEQNNFEIHNWQCIDLKIIDYLEKKISSTWGMDTIYLGDRLSTHISKYLIYYNDCKEYHKSSGILVVTAVGSMGWYRSAISNNNKGLPLNMNKEEIHFVVREIYQGKKEKIINVNQGSINKNQNIKIRSLMDKEGIINIDSTKEISFLRGKIVEIKPSTKRKIKILFPKALK